MEDGAGEDAEVRKGDEADAAVVSEVDEDVVIRAGLEHAAVGRRVAREDLDEVIRRHLAMLVVNVILFTVGMHAPRWQRLLVEGFERPVCSP